MENISQKTKILAFISYIPFPPLFIVPMFVAKADTFAEFHSKQGLVLFLGFFALWAVGFIPIVMFVAYIGFVALIIAAIVGAVQALLGNRWSVPVLGRYAQKLKF